MSATSFAFSPSPEISSYEHEQRARLLHYMLIAVFIGGIVNSISNYLNGWIAEAAILFLLALVCLAGFYLNSIHRYRLAGWIFCISFYIVISLLLQEGVGLYDTAILGFPIFMLCAAFLFGRRGLVLAMIASMLTVFTIYFLELAGMLVTPYPTSVLRALIISFLFGATAMIIWIVHTTWITNLTLLNESYDLTLRGWARALEFRDGETAGHSQRVTQLSVAIGKAMGLDLHDISNLRYGAYLHDIGKMAIPDPILLKPGPLTEEEWEIMKQHPARGREFLAEIPFLQGAIPITYSHHERWDGKGYPEGLQGEHIPLLARIFAVVDNWDALTSDRPYRKAWNEEEAVAFLKENAGTMFDPGVVDTFLTVLEKKKLAGMPTKPVRIKDLVI